MKFLNGKGWKLTANEKTVVITGGAGGLGFPTAVWLKNFGYKVIVVDLKKTDDISRGNFDFFKADVTDSEVVESVINEIITKYNKIDVLINFAGVIYNEPIINIMNPSKMRHDFDNFKKNININLNSVFLVSSFVIEQMVMKRTKGVIINISSISASGNAGQTAYSAAKAGVEAMTKTWAKELGSFGIRSVAVAPGFIDTSSTSSALNENIINHIKTNTPLKRLGKEENISKTVQFIIENDFINGTVVKVNGGLSI